MPGSNYAEALKLRADRQAEARAQAAAAWQDFELVFTGPDERRPVSAASRAIRNANGDRFIGSARERGTALPLAREGRGTCRLGGGLAVSGAEGSACTDAAENPGAGPPDTVILAQTHVTRAPWAVTMIVSCLPVLVLGMAAGLAHLLRADAHAARDRLPCGPDQEDQAGGGVMITEDRLAQAREAAARLRAAGQRVSRRSLRAAGLRGSNAELGAVSTIVGSQPGRLRDNASAGCVDS